MRRKDRHSIHRIRTFADDVIRARGEKEKNINTSEKVNPKTSKTPTKTSYKNKANQATDFLQTTKPKLSTLKKIPAKKSTSDQKTIQPKKKTKDTEINKNSKKTPKVKPTPATKKNITSPELKEKQSASHLDTTLGHEGTLITNKRKRRYRLFPSIYLALQQWFQVKKRKHIEEQKPKHTISKAESRIETLTAAARASTHAPQSDHGVVIKRLTKKQRPKQTSEVLIKKKEETPLPQWSSLTSDTTEKSTTKHPTTDITTTIIPEKKNADSDTHIHHAPLKVRLDSTQKVSHKKQTKEPLIPYNKEMNKDTQTDTLSQNAHPTHTTPDVPIPRKTQPQTQSKHITTDKIKKNTPENTRIHTTPKKSVSQKKYTSQKKKHTTSGISIYLYGVVIVIASVLGLAVSLYWFTGSTPTQEATIIHIPSLFVSDTTIPVNINTQTRLLSTMKDLAFTTRETVLLYPSVFSESGIDIPADTKSILSALQFKAPNSFIRGIIEINFGTYNGTDPFILLNVKNFDTAFSGLLQWEPEMSNDLSPLFGSPVQESYDPFARTDTQLRSAFFRDTIVANKSARVLVNENNTEKILYGFVNPNLLLITTNSETFTAVLPLITQ